MRRQLLRKCWSKNYKYILDKFPAIHFDLIFLLRLFKFEDILVLK